MRTGKQVFEDVILSQIDNTVEVLTIIAEDALTITFRVCDPKWLMPGDSFIDSNDQNWSVISVDVNEFIVKAGRLQDDFNLQYGAIIFLTKPTFISGTRLNAQQELTLRQEAGQAVPSLLVWLKESIKLRIPPKNASAARWFDFNWFCLTEYDYRSALNNDRHQKAIYPMTQLGQEILNTIDRIMGVERNDDCESHELSRFGVETKDGFESYILQLNVSGTSYSAKIRVDEVHLCECN